MFIRVPSKINVYGQFMLPSLLGKLVGSMDRAQGCGSEDLDHLKLILCITQVNFFTPRNEEIAWRYLSPKVFLLKEYSINLGI